MSTVADLITQAFLDLGVIQPGETITTAMQTDAFLRLNQMLSSWSTEGATVFGQVIQAFPLQAGVSAYTLGATGTLATSGALRAQKVTAWSAVYGTMRKGSPALAFAEFDAAAQAKASELAELYTRALAEGVIVNYPFSFSAPVPSVLGADTAYPNLNIRIYPTPGSNPGSLELAYWVPIVAFALVSDAVSLPPGFDAAIHWNLAVALYPVYPLTAEIPAAVAANASSAKAVIVQQNMMMQQQATGQ